MNLFIWNETEKNVRIINLPNAHEEKNCLKISFDQISIEICFWFFFSQRDCIISKQIQAILFTTLKTHINVCCGRRRITVKCEKSRRKQTATLMSCYDNKRFEQKETLAHGTFHVYMYRDSVCCCNQRTFCMDSRCSVHNNSRSV